MLIKSKDDYVHGEFVVSWKPQKLAEMNGDLHCNIWVIDPVQRVCKPTRSVRYAEHEMHLWNSHVELHKWENNPFTEEVHERYMNNRWYLRTANLRHAASVQLTDDWNIASVTYSYDLIWWDGLEWRVRIAKKYGVDVNVKCCPAPWMIEVRYSITSSWNVLFRTIREDEQPTPDLIREWDEPLARTFRLTAMTQEEYNRFHPGNTEITFVTNN